jgi:hypothetical protein
MDETDHGLTPRIQGFGSEQENQSNQRSTQTTPAPVLGLRTASYCTENEGTPSPIGVNSNGWTSNNEAWVIQKLIRLELP